MRNLKVHVIGPKVELEITGIDASEHEEEIRSTIDSLQLLFLDVLETNLTWKGLSRSAKDDRLVSHLTLGMATQAYIVIAAEKSKRHQSVLIGAETLAHNGFPEFDGHKYLND